MPEIELKLAASPTDLCEVKRKLLTLAGRKRAVQATLTSVYYDTEDHELRRQGLTLRVRERNRRYLQTVKSDDAVGLLPAMREEWEDAVAGAHPDLRAPNCGAHLPAALTEADLRPVFVTTVRRAVVALRPDATTEIEAAIDDGAIETSESRRGEPICEIELEHKLGDPAAIYDIGLRLIEVAPLRIEMRSKAERGFDLLEAEGREPQAVHAPPIALDPAMTVEAVLQRSGCECLAVVLRNEPAALAGNAEGVHQMRVAIRRLRAVLNTMRRMLPGDQYRWVGEELRWLARALGPARNWDVLTDGILAPVTSAFLGPEDRDALSRAAERERRRAHQEAQAAIRSARYTTALLKLLRWFAARDWRDQPVSKQSALLMAPIDAVAPGLIARRHKQLRNAIQDFAALDMEQRHQVRIAVKKLRYTVDLLESLFPQDAVAAFVRLLKPLQDGLGQANDVRVASDLMAELRVSDDSAAIDRAAGIVLGWHDRGLAEHEHKLLKQLDKFRHARTFW
jgi:inorganic triphosphatase YgiF